MKKIILISHMPCTGGTFYTHYISKLLSHKSFIVPETNPFSVFSINQKSITPFSINAASFKSGIYDFKTFKENYTKELIGLISSFEKSDYEVLIIRDHAWSEFNTENFDKKIPILPEILDKNHINYIPILTLRDPIDSFLALKKSFPQIFINLNQYSLIYKNFVDSWRNYHDRNLIELKTEDFVNDFDKIEKLLFEKFKLSKENFRYNLIVEEQELTSGASGRKESKPHIFKRRPYTLWAHFQFNKDMDFNNLRKSLNYNSKVNYESFNKFIFSLFHNLYQPILNLRISKSKRLKNLIKFEFLAFF